ncbi:MAG: substrate-binding domain-containing protein [Lachnospiraceae bacterium]|nr:substrate-binding domain-containing protein [Lachnospiraceae bacterium]MDD3794557.1 substrate-binding domain-containing protein [Lachnospiraceae bacterium]
MKKKILGVLGLAALTLAVTAGSAFASDTEVLKVGLSFVSLNFPYYVRMYDQFMADAEENGWEVSFVDGNLDATTQLNGMQDLVNDDVDVMVVSTWYIDAMEDVFQQCADKDIPVFIIGNTENPENINDLIVYACGTEHYAAGHLGGTYFSTYLDGMGKDSLNMAIMVGSTEQMKARGQGFVDALEENGISVNVLNDYDVSTREDAMASGEDALTTYSDIELFYGVSAQGALGAYDATVGANRTEVMVFGYDGEDEEMEVIDKGENYIGTITQAPDVEASTTVEYIKKYLAGETFDKIVPISAGIYCKDGQLTAEEVEAAAAK